MKNSRVLIIIAMSVMFTLINTSVFSFVLVEGGVFQMGNTLKDNDGGGIEAVEHTVRLTYAYWIGRHEVTFMEYDAFWKEKNWEEPWNESGTQSENRPVIGVNWSDAIAYCNWLSENENLPMAYDRDGNLLDEKGRITTDIVKVMGYRLPTEAEWEYAARGGHQNKIDYKFAGSHRLQDVAWFKDNADYQIQPVGLKKPNELGITDMSGNVWEWCHDGYDWYTDETQVNPIGPPDETYKVVRGGSWNYYLSDCRVSSRFYLEMDQADYDLGFRVARTAGVR